MVNEREALDRLNKEKQFEDRLSQNLSYYLTDCLDNITGLTAEEKQKIRENLEIIKGDSMRHLIYSTN